METNTDKNLSDELVHVHTHIVKALGIQQKGESAKCF